MPERNTLTQTDVVEQVELRIAELHREPAQLLRYDLDASGELDESEWELVRRIVAAEVEHGLVREGRLNPDAEPLTGIVGERFEIVGLLGAGGQARTWLATDRVSGHAVALKELTLSRAADWKSIELFEREARVLQSLSHPCIPAYVRAFHDEGPLGERSGTRFFLAQEYVEGDNLLKGLARHQWSEADALTLLREVLDVLRYLHGRSPPVIHRDVKPSNLIRRPNGPIALIDFGAVQTVSPTLTGGSTIVGSNGYMPLEQYMGRAVPATDLYGLGATLVHLLSRRHPADLPLVRARIQFTDVVNVSSGLKDVLARLLEPAVEDRFSSADEVLAALDAPTAEPAVSPAGSAVRDAKPKPARSKPNHKLTPERRIARSFRRLVGLLVVFCIIQTGLWASPRCGGGHDAATQALELCPPAVAALGDDPGQTWLGLACGNCEASGSCSEESWSGGGSASMRVSGSRASGAYDYSTSMQGCDWSVTHAILEVEDETISVVPCLVDGEVVK